MSWRVFATGQRRRGSSCFYSYTNKWFLCVGLATLCFTPCAKSDIGQSPPTLSRASFYNNLCELPESYLCITLTNMSAVEVANNASRHKHAALTGIGRWEKIKRLYIQSCDKNKLSAYNCHSYHLEPNGEKWVIILHKKAFSPDFVIQELGWLLYLGVFCNIILSVPVPTMRGTSQQEGIQSHEEEIFKTWIDEVLQEVNKSSHAEYWQRNDGLSV